MKKIIILLICTFLLLTSIVVGVNANKLLTASNNDTPPNQPVINGPSSGKIKETYIYYVSVSDPDEEDLLIKVEIDFGDGSGICGGCDGRGPWHSGDIVEFNHSWTRKGIFVISARACDEHGVWSEWSDPLPITMPCTYNPMQRFFELLYQRFLNAFPILHFQFL